MPRLSPINRAGVLMGVCTFFLAVIPAAAEETVGTVHRVEMREFAFVPATVTVRTGDSVEWVNLDIAPHTATAVNAVSAGTDAKPHWNTGRLNQGERRRITFHEAGRMDYLCLFHPVMKGNVIVNPSEL